MRFRESCQLLLTAAGANRSGKTSIQQVLFNDLNPKQAFFVEPTTRLTKHKIECVSFMLSCISRELTFFP